MDHKSLATVLNILVLVLGGCAGRAEELVDALICKSPDGRKELKAKMWIEPTWTSPRIDVVLKEGEKMLFQTTIPPEKEARYVKLSWAPSAEAALVAINLKSSEDWILIRLAEGKASSVYFDGGKLLKERMLETLPFQEEIKSSAPVGRVPWKTVRWRDRKQCAMTFIFHGIGYEGTARLLIDFQREKPSFTIESIVPTVDAELWKQN